MTAKAKLPGSKFTTFADVLARLGDVPPERVRLSPMPGTATEADLVKLDKCGEPLYELVDGILVEKVMGYRQGVLGVRMSTAISNFVDAGNLGVVAGSDGMIKFGTDHVRLPDVSFIRWDSANDPAEVEDPKGAFLTYTPDLVVEIMSPGNTAKEMAIKLDEYTRAKVKLIWYVYPDREEVDVYTKGRLASKKTVDVNGTLDGGTVLPGFRLSLKEYFARREPPKRKK